MRRFVAFWLVLTLVLMVLLVIGMLFPAMAGAQETGDESAINSLVESMAGAVRSGDQAAYLAHVDLSDPVFALEHARWTDDWAQNAPVSRYDLELDDLVIDGNSATAEMTLRWAIEDAPAQKAVFPVRFVKRSEWLYAGEAWNTFESEHFVVRALPGLESAAGDLLDTLPDVYDHVTGSLGYAPTVKSEIKLYPDPQSLIANTLLSLPLIRGWNEPGESLKMLVQPGDKPDRAVLAHEFTHFLSFDMAGTTQGRYPWWLLEGIAEVVSSKYWSPEKAAERLEMVKDWLLDGELVAWAEISDFESTPLDLWGYVYPQGYAFVRYVTETYGEDQRNIWFAAMAGEMTLDEATESVFGLSFDDLNAEFLVWIEKA